MAIYIGNKHYSEVIGIEVYCGRPKNDSKSPLRNIYIIGVDGTRDEVCNKYESRFQALILQDTKLRREVIRVYRLAKTNDITLMCWCVNSKVYIRCHCETIKNFLDKQLGESIYGDKK